mmetsp:Transcript_66141/g.96848  ORF Transcript_66141/g.96848 Transcript_66141/m.96848 type:complete len:226 (-) Transcript_66141:341-1018(-)
MKTGLLIITQMWAPSATDVRISDDHGRVQHQHKLVSSAAKPITSSSASSTIEVMQSVFVGTDGSPKSTRMEHMGMSATKKPPNIKTIPPSDSHGRSIAPNPCAHRASFSASSAGFGSPDHALRSSSRTVDTAEISLHIKQAIPIIPSANPTANEPVISCISSGCSLAQSCARVSTSSAVMGSPSSSDCADGFASSPDACRRKCRALCGSTALLTSRSSSPATNPV